MVTDVVVPDRMKVLCVFGKYAYGDEARGLSPEFQAFVPALKRAGHDVVLFDSWNRAGYSELAELNARLLATIENERPDVMLFVPFLYEIWIETLSIIKNRGDVLSICWTTDDSWKYGQQSRFIAPAFHAITTTYPNVLAKYRADGIEHAVLTQWAAPDDALMPPLPAAECSWPVTFVGASHGNRKSRLDWLKERGINVEAFGYGWPNGPVSVSRMREVIRQSVISLNFANSRGDNQIKARTFEVPGAGGFLLTEHAPSLEDFYRIGEEIDSFHDPDELERKIRHYLKDAAERDAMAMRAFERTRDEHTYSARLRDVISFAVRAKADWEKHRAPTPHLTLDGAFQRHRIGWIHRAARAVLVGVATLVAGRRRGRKAARRLLFELSVRLTGMKTYTAAGLPGRWFPKG
jgi:spore maturation protein CgeB